VTTILRCHQLPAAALCSQSAQRPEVWIDDPAPISLEGTALHHHHKNFILTGEALDLDKLAERYKVEAENLRYPAWAFTDWWKRHGWHFPSPEVECEMEWHDERHDIILRGTADLISPSHDDPTGTLNGADYKTGFGDADAEQQCRGYAWLALQSSDAERVRYVAPRTRINQVDGYLWTRAELAEWWEALASRIVAGGPYTPGVQQCRYCPRQLECPALGQMVRAARAWFGSVVGAEMAERLGALTSEEMLTLHQTAKAVGRMAETISNLIRLQVAQRGGSVEADGWELAIKETRRREINVLRGREVLPDEMGAIAYTEALRISNSDVEKAVKDAAPPRGKAAAVKRLWDRLDEAGAVVVTFQERLELRRKAKDDSISNDERTTQPLGITGGPALD
jgi:hypothetical protein